MKRKFSSIIITLTLALAPLALTPSAAFAAAGSETEYVPGFVLREYEGKIAAFENGSAEPIAIYDTPVNSLYPADVKLLEEGIRLKSRVELSRLIEDLDLE